MKKVTVAEYCRRTGKSDRTIRKWISSGRLQTTEEIVNNRKITMIFVDDPEIVDENSIRPSEQNNLLQNNFNSDEISLSKQDDLIELIKKMYEQNTSLVLDIKKYAELAGTAKLLTDSENKTKQQYFEVVQENKILSQDKAELKAEIKYLQEKLKTQKEKKLNNWWSKL